MNNIITSSEEFPLQTRSPDMHGGVLHTPLVSCPHPPLPVRPKVVSEQFILQLFQNTLR